MTLEHDFMQIETVFFGVVRTTLISQGLNWPPPEFMCFVNGHFRKAIAETDRSEIFERYSMSCLTDEQAKDAPNIARGATYRYVEPINADVGNA